MTLISLAFDTSEISNEINRTLEPLAATFPDGVPDEILGYFLGLSSDIVLGELSTASGTDGGTSKVTCALRFGSSLEQFASALRTLKRDDVLAFCHAMPSLNS